MKLKSTNLTLKTNPEIFRKALIAVQVELDIVAQQIINAHGEALITMEQEEFMNIITTSINKNFPQMKGALSNAQTVFSVIIIIFQYFLEEKLIEDFILSSQLRIVPNSSPPSTLLVSTKTEKKLLH